MPYSYFPLSVGRAFGEAIGAFAGACQLRDVWTQATGTSYCSNMRVWNKQENPKTGVYLPRDC